MFNSFLCLHACEGQRPTSGAVLRDGHSSFFFFQARSLSGTWGLLISRLAVQQVPDVLLSLPLQHWDYKYCHHSSSYCGLWGLNLVLHAWQALYRLIHLPSPSLFSSLILFFNEQKVLILMTFYLSIFSFVSCLF